MNEPEHFVSCAQVKVTDGGSGSPSPTVKFPGAYKDTDAYANFSIYNGYKEFTFPGPDVGSGGSNSTTSAASDDTSSSSSTSSAVASKTSPPLKTATPTTLVTKVATPAPTSVSDDSCDA